MVGLESGAKTNRLVKQMAIGRKTGGRKKGTPNRRTAEMRAEMAATGELPLDYMLRIMRDPSADEKRRDYMARAAAPYLHAQLQSTQVQQLGADGQPIGPKIVEVERQIETATEAASGAEATRGVSKYRH
jgi:hypothetical protein